MIILAQRWGLVLGLTVICWWLVMTNPNVQAFNFNADQFTLPSLADDILRNPGFSLSDWNLPRAPYFFPDFLVYFVVRWLVTDTYVAIYICAALHLVALAIGVMLICRKAFADERSANAALFIFLLLSTLLLVLGQRLWPWNLVVWPFVSLAHGTYAVAALYMFLFYERFARPGTLRSHVIGALLCSALVFSDRLFLFYFSVPYAFVLLFDRPLRRKVVNLAAFGLSQAVAVAVGWAINTRLVLQPIDQPSLRILENLKTVWRMFRDTSVPSHWLFVILNLLAAAVLAFVAARRRSSDLPVSRRVALFAAAATVVGAGINVILWRQPEGAYGRYAAGFQLGGLLTLSFLGAWLLRRRPLPALSVVGAAVVGCLAFWLGNPSSVAAPFVERQNMRAAFSDCRKTHHLQAGWAAYWRARTLTIMLDWATQINQFEPGKPVPYFWGNNARWFLFPIESHEPLVYNFVVDRDLERDDILKRFGPPSREVDCGGFHLLLYDSEVLQISRLRAYSLAGRQIPPAEFGRGLAVGFSDMNNTTGSLSSLGASAISPRDKQGFLLYGPYIELAVGKYILKLSLRCTEATNHSYFDVSADAGRRVLATKTLIQGSSPCSGAFQEESLAFDVDARARNIEFRVYYGGGGEIEVRGLTVQSAPD